MTEKAKTDAKPEDKYKADKEAAAKAGVPFYPFGAGSEIVPSTDPQVIDPKQDPMDSGKSAKKAKEEPKDPPKEPAKK